MAPDYELTELADQAGVSVRTVRYYIQAGLLPRPEARGPGAHYSDEHLERLRLIRRLQKEHLPLAEIRRVIESGAVESSQPVSARDYIKSVLGRGEPEMMSEAAPAYRSMPAEQPLQTTRSQWERVTLAPDIELHIRRPLSRAANRQVEKLIDIARDLFEED